jgi:hypothetical protein
MNDIPEKWRSLSYPGDGWLRIISGVDEKYPDWDERHYKTDPQDIQNHLELEIILSDIFNWNSQPYYSLTMIYNQIRGLPLTKLGIKNILEAVVDNDLAELYDELQFLFRPLSNSITRAFFNNLKKRMIAAWTTAVKNKDLKNSKSISGLFKIFNWKKMISGELPPHILNLCKDPIYLAKTRKSKLILLIKRYNPHPEDIHDAFINQL